MNEPIEAWKFRCGGEYHVTFDKAEADRYTAQGFIVTPLGQINNLGKLLSSAYDRIADFVRDKAETNTSSRAPDTAPSAGQAALSDRDAMDDQVMRERDSYHEMADKLADAIGKYFGRDIGEHSSANCPWHAALEVIDNAAPYAAKDQEQAAQSAPTKYKLSQEERDALQKAAETRAHFAEMADGKIMFINYGDGPQDYSDLDCPHCGGSGHKGDIAPSAGPAAQSAPASKNWTEDSTHENGNYQCHCVYCKSGFIMAARGRATPAQSSALQADISALVESANGRLAAFDSADIQPSDAIRWRFGAENGFPKRGRQIHPVDDAPYWYCGDLTDMPSVHETPEQAIDAAIKQSTDRSGT